MLELISGKKRGAEESRETGRAAEPQQENQINQVSFHALLYSSPTRCSSLIRTIMTTLDQTFETVDQPPNTAPPPPPVVPEEPYSIFDKRQKSLIILIVSTAATCEFTSVRVGDTRLFITKQSPALLQISTSPPCLLLPTI